MARTSDSFALLIVPLTPDLIFTLTDAVRFFMRRHHVPREAGASLLGTLKRVLEDLPPGRGSARLSLRASRGAVLIRLGLSRVRLPGSRLRSVLRRAHPLLEVTSHSSGSALSFRVPVSEKR